MASLQFKTTTARRKQDRRKLFIVLAILLVIVLAASLATYFKEHNSTGTDEKITTEEEITLVEDKGLKDSVNLLVTGVTTSENTVEFMLVVNLDTVDGEVNVIGVKAPNGADASKPVELVSSVEKSSGLAIDRYVILNQKKFKAFIKYLGSYEVNLKENVNYSSDEFSINLLKGKQILSGEKFYNYLRYLYMGGSDYALQNVSEVVADYISQNFTEATTENGQDLFENLASSCETDITIIDYSKYESFLGGLPEKESFVNAVNIADLENDR